MDRRELLKRSAALACVAALPEVLTFNLPLLGQDSAWPPRLAWPETAASLAHRNAMMPLLHKFHANRQLNTLTPDEWDVLAIHHQYYHGMHGEVGHFRAIDAAIKANETYLKTRYNPIHIDTIMKHGTYAMCLRDAGSFHEIAHKLRLEQHAQKIIEDFGGRFIEVQYYNACVEFFGAMAIAFALIALCLGPEVGLFFALLGIMNDTTALLGCG